MDIVLYALTVLLYGGLAVAGWRARRVGAARPLVASVPAVAPARESAPGGMG
ncbi:ABC transporter permease, partial [Burkholderia pseudomallei]|nr:inner membrane protein YpjD [Burkholderia pseudomallei]MCW0166428.1 inner membrane protein YpjD [Burkholderia pseudomallei]MDY7761900.1 inner membrane protein YpjD [Burkholderia pseudomallei]MDY7781276.1 inner membrane protein YpjD [Burkholderia pseudomallei]MWA27831.1 inner membrane protein YpjD [Burkholderia pseudomallei]